MVRFEQSKVEHAATDECRVLQSTFFVIFPTKFAVLYTLANVFALSR